MADETRRDLTPEREGATQNRDRRHEPPIIEGEVAGSEEAAESTTPESDSTAKPAAGEALAEDGAESAALGSDAKLGGEPSPPSAGEARGASARPVLSAAVGALIGAIVVAAGVWALEPRRGPDPEAVARLEALERSPTPAALAALDKRVAALETSSAATPSKDVLNAYGQRLAALESAALSAKASADRGPGPSSHAHT